MSSGYLIPPMTANLELFESECRVPILVGIDCGMTGAIVINDAQGNAVQHKMPALDKGIDLYAICDIVKGADFVLMENPGMGGKGRKGKTTMSENGCFQQYKEIYGALCALKVPFYTLRPQAWQKYMGFPTKASVGDDDLWKKFLHSQAIQRFPQQKKLTLYAADAWLLFDIARKIYPLNPEQWP